MLAINKLKQSEGQLKVQKDKIEAKFSEVCENNRDLQAKNKEKDLELQSMRLANESILLEFADEKNTLIAELAQLSERTKQLENELKELTDQANEK